MLNNFACKVYHSLPTHAKRNKTHGEAWDNATKIQRVFRIGKQEPLAVSALQQSVSPATVEIIKEAVRVRGMRSWISHELISKGTFNVGWSSGSGNTEAWSDQLTNRPDNVLAP